jgi:hypothetical protein
MKKMIVIIVILLASLYVYGVFYFDKYTLLYKREETRYILAKTIATSLYSGIMYSFNDLDLAHIAIEKTKYQSMLEAIPVPFSLKNLPIYSHKLIINKTIACSEKFDEIKYYIGRPKEFITKYDNGMARFLYDNMYKCKGIDECYIDIYVAYGDNCYNENLISKCKEYKFLDRIAITFEE